jgi:hypothetical protein
VTFQYGRENQPEQDTMKKYTTEQKAQALKLLEQDGATQPPSHAPWGSHPHRQRLGESPHRRTSNVLSIEEMRERAQRAVEATPTAKLLRLKNHFTEKQYELLNRPRDRPASPPQQGATGHGDAVMMKAIASLIAVMIKRRSTSARSTTSSPAPNTRSSARHEPPATVKTAGKRFTAVLPPQKTRSPRIRGSAR